jgi:hypothetical protein
LLSSAGSLYRDHQFFIEPRQLGFRSVGTSQLVKRLIDGKFGRFSHDNPQPFDKEKRSRQPMINFEEARVFDLAQDEVLLNGLSTSTKTLDVRNCRGLCIRLVETGIVRQ